MALHQPHRRFTVEEFHRMAEAGILGEDDRVELIEGENTEMTPWPLTRRYRKPFDEATREHLRR